MEGKGRRAGRVLGRAEKVKEKVLLHEGEKHRHIH